MALVDNDQVEMRRRKQPCSIICFTVTFLMSKPISAYRLGEAYARNMGVNITALRIMLILMASLMAACVTAFAGPISFVGIAVPHLMKSMIDEDDHELFMNVIDGTDDILDRMMEEKSRNKLIIVIIFNY